ncbi:hypothetical protein FOA52_007068 [Chlamydomonas sp. UWO 241]|nr:hypothetical protein FOA52_007068 [Chlamydomonas sp. UWO 241]
MAPPKGSPRAADIVDIVNPVPDNVVPAAMRGSRAATSLFKEEFRAAQRLRSTEGVFIPEVVRQTHPPEAGPHSVASHPAPSYSAGSPPRGRHPPAGPGLSPGKRGASAGARKPQGLWSEQLNTHGTDYTLARPLSPHARAAAGQPAGGGSPGGSAGASAHAGSARGSPGSRPTSALASSLHSRLTGGSGGGGGGVAGGALRPTPHVSAAGSITRLLSASSAAGGGGDFFSEKCEIGDFTLFGAKFPRVAPAVSPQISRFAPAAGAAGAAGALRTSLVQSQLAAVCLIDRVGCNVHSMMTYA